MDRKIKIGHETSIYDRKSKPYVIRYPDMKINIAIPDTNIILYILANLDVEKHDEKDLERMIHDGLIRIIKYNVPEANQYYISPIMWGEVSRNVGHSKLKRVLGELGSKYNVHQESFREQRFSELLQDRKFVHNLRRILEILVPDIIPNSQRINPTSKSRKIGIVYETGIVNKPDMLGIGEIIRSEFDTYLILLILTKKLLNSIQFRQEFEGILDLKGFIDRSEYELNRVDHDLGYNTPNTCQNISLYPVQLFKSGVAVLTYDGPLHNFLIKIKER